MNNQIIKYALTYLLSNIPDVIEDIKDYVNLSEEELEAAIQAIIDDMS